ncbi:MAG: TauD/TfdA family dioxygenase [Ectothiorhodospiraceae bacterium]|nr:TauD/TfdA family dioxygenase [Chromatiales bacterium]MCP5153311.1 TauD/TfdA family dioxygenase [Ectothiorhodospiraceae bacterium]
MPAAITTIDAHQNRYRRIRAEPVSGVVGARVDDVDLAALDAETVGELRHAFAHHGVLVFPAQHLTPAQQVAFTRHFGEVEQHPLYRTATLPEQPEILVLEHKTGQFINGRNDVWHADITFAERPPLGSVLYCKDTRSGFGDTLFCSMGAAYEALSPGLRKLLDGLRAVHGAARMVARNNAQTYNLRIDDVPDEVVHPVVRTHPETGRRMLFVNPIYTLRFEGWTEAESQPLLDHLYAVATRPENVYRHRWAVGDVVMFDNRALMHYVAVDYAPSVHRLMHRTTAAGDRPR